MSEDYFVPLKLKPRLGEESGLGPAQLMIKDFESRSPPPVMQSALESRPMMGCRSSIPDMRQAIGGDLSAEAQRSHLLFESTPEGRMNVRASQTRELDGREMPLKESSPLAGQSENLRTAQEKMNEPEKKDRNSSSL